MIMKHNTVKPMHCNGSKIEKLISELCPEGVEWKTLGEVGTLIRGNGLQKKDFVEDTPISFWMGSSKRSAACANFSGSR